MPPTAAQHAQALAVTAQFRADHPPQAHNSHLADPDTLAILLNAFSRGLNDKDACAAAGLHHATLVRWMDAADKHPETAAAQFAVALKAARAQGKLRRLERIEKAGEKDQFWTANAWMLERTDPEQFALRKEDTSVPQIVVHAEGAKSITIGIRSGDTVRSAEFQQDSVIPTGPALDAAPTITDRRIPADESGGGSTPPAPPAYSHDTLSQGKSHGTPPLGKRRHVKTADRSRAAQARARRAAVAPKEKTG